MTLGIEQVWQQVLHNSIGGGVLAGFFLLGVFLFRGRLSPAWGFAFALVVFVRLVIPANPSMGPSLFVLPHVESSESISPPPEWETPSEVSMERRPLTAKEVDWLTGIAIPPTDLAVVSSLEADSAKPPVDSDPPARWDSFLSLLPLFWLGGVIAFVLIVCGGHLRQSLRIRQKARPASAALGKLLRECCQRMEMKDSVTLEELPDLSSPALFGTWKPRILIPAELDSKFSHEEISAIFLHELAHLKRCDLWWNWLGCGVLCLHWFNPLVWIVVKRFRSDREQLCDRLAVQKFAQTHLYSATLLKLLEHFSVSPGPENSVCPSMASVFSKKSELKHRLVMIHQKNKQSLVSPCLSLLALVAVGWLSFPSFADEEKKDVPKRGEREEVRRGDRDRPEGREARRDGDVPRDGGRDHPEAREARGDGDRPKPEARGDRDREHPERDQGRRDGDRVVPESRRDQPRDERGMAEHERARQMHLEKMHKGLADARRTGRHEEAEMIERRIKEMHQQIEWERGDRGRGNPHGEAEARMHHMRVAAENLERAGLHDEARRYREQAEEIERDLHAARRGHGEGDERADRLQREVHELHEIVGQLRREIEELKNSRGRD